MAVYTNALDIAEHEGIIRLDIITVASLLHDVCDHKYLDMSISKKELHDFIHTLFDETDALRVIAIIDNNSYSTEKKGDYRQVQ